KRAGRAVTVDVYHAASHSGVAPSTRAAAANTTTMGRMRACATANAIFLGLTLGALSFAACSSGQPPPQSPTEPGSVAPPSPSPSPSAAEPGSAPATGAAAPTPPPKGPPRSDITNEPDGGVVMNNAQPAGDAGGSDRFQSLTDLIKASRDGF